MLVYKSVSKFNEYVQARKEMLSKDKGYDVTYKEIYKEIAEFCGVKEHSIKQMKDKAVQPSLPVAIRLAKFFNTTVEDMWDIIEVEEKEERTTKRVTNKEKICNKENCHKKVVARGLCNKHYQQYRLENLDKVKRKQIDQCTVEGCVGKHYAKGLCTHHYNVEYTKGRIRG